mmetsp:Transcript_21534/g.44353  ORF Transcript_21534/g.44353 Transcript_21534/m.44353 type:complete len:321 (+) Transcript_21534:158-1120(+)
MKAVLLILRVLILAAVAASTAVVHAKVINADATASWLEKRTIGVAQSLQWLQELVLQTPEARPPRTVTVAVVGLGRTGSTSFSVALKKLGYAPIHDDEVPEVADIYKSMMDESLTMDEVNAALGRRGFDAPFVSTHRYVEWAATAPNVKVVLTVRDKTKWAQSWLSVVPAAFIPEQRPFRWIKSISDLSAVNREVMIAVPTNGRPEKYNDVPTLEAGYEAWTDFVRSTVPRDRLLEFDVRKGWEPLCQFLDKPIPDEPFPHINDRIVVDTIIKVFVLITWIWPLLFAVPLMLIYHMISLLRRRRQSHKSMDSSHMRKKMS